MSKIFGFPILIAVLAGVLFPYTALSLMPFGFAFLFVLMLLSGLSIDWGKLPAALKHPYELALGFFFLFLFFPLLQLALARVLAVEPQFLEGLVFGSLMPVALVAPFFTKEVKGDEELAFSLMVLSMLAAPILSPLLLKLMTATILPIRTTPLMKNMLLLVSLPIAVSYAISRYLPGMKKGVEPYLALGNMLTLSVLIFILFGNAVGRMNLGYESFRQMGLLLGIAFFQDFGVLALARLLVPRLAASGPAKALVTALCMKNVAIATGILLFYDPRASIAPALVFVAHACLFSFLPICKNYLWPAEPS